MNNKTLSTQIDSALKAAEKNPGKIILITGGPTCEDIDPVRFITNRSTGRMGIESAIAARELGLSPILILGPTHLSIDDPKIPLINIRSAEDLFQTLSRLFKNCNYLIMSAAVADFTPVTTSLSKLKKAEIEDSNHEFILKLKRTKDILAELNKSELRPTKLIAGFSLDTDINITEGLRKLSSKGLDLIAINSTEAFEKESSSITIITRDHSQIDLESNNKRNTAKTIINELIRLEKLDNTGRQDNDR